MYQVSEEYKAALCKSVITDRITGKITLSDGAELAINDAAVVKGSLKISHELCGSYKIGTFNLGCLKMGIYDDSALGRDFSGAVVEPIYGLKTSAGWEDVPLGIYRIDGKSVKRKRNAVYFTAYDNGTLFDCPPESWVGSNYRTPEWYINQLCKQCGVEFGGMDEGLPNSDKYFYAKGSQLQTCRDVIMWFATLLCAYAVIDRTGALRIISAKYSVSDDDATEITIDKKLTAEERKSIYVTDTRAHIKCLTAYSGLKTKSYVSSVVQTDEQAAPATYVLAKNPILSELSESECDEINNSWLEYIDGFKQRGITAELYGDPALDVGDVMRCYGGDIDQRRSIVGLVTSQEWRYRSYHLVTCAAPDLIFDEEQTATNSVSTRSQTDKRIDGSLFKVGTGLRNTDGEISLRAAGTGSEKSLGGVYTNNQGLTIEASGRIYANYAANAKSNVYSAYGSIALGEGLVTVSESGDEFRRTAVDLGQGMEYEDIPIPEGADTRYIAANDGEKFLYRKKIRPLLGSGLEFVEKTAATDDEDATYAIQPKLGEGLKFDENDAIAVDGAAGGSEYTAGTGINISSDNQISLAPAGASIGGVKAGEGVNIAADGTISVTGGGADISAGGGIEISTDEDEKTKIAVKCGEGCEINDNGELVTVPNIENAIFISESDAKYLLHEYTQIEYIAGNQIVYAGASNPVIVQGYVLPRYFYSGDDASSFIVYIKDDEDGSIFEEKISRFSFFSRIELNNTYFKYKSCYITELRLTFVSWSDMYMTYNLEYVDAEGTATTLHTLQTRNAAGAPIGIMLVYNGIVAPNVTKNGYSSETGFVIAYYGYKQAPSTNGYYFYRELKTQTNELYIPFASLAEYNAAVGLTYEPLSLTQLSETTTVV